MLHCNMMQNSARELDTCNLQDHQSRSFVSKDKDNKMSNLSSSAQAKSYGHGDLKSVIATSQCYCLNEQSNYPFTNLFAGDETLQLKSDADEQIILYIEFQDAVKIHSMKIVAPAGESAPKLVKLFVNRPNLGFSDVLDIEPTQSIEISDSHEISEHDLELRYVKFQRVNNLTIFVEENNGDEITVLSGLKFYGEPLAGTNMNELKKVGHDE